MNNRKLIITWKTDVSSMVLHDLRHLDTDGYKGITARSERDSFRNVKTIEKAQRIVSKRNPHQILFATYNNEVIFART